MDNVDESDRLLDAAAHSCVDWWLRDDDLETGAYCDCDPRHMHPTACRAVYVDEDGHYQASTGREFRFGSLLDGAQEMAFPCETLQCDLVRAGDDQSAAAIHVCVYDQLDGWLVFLKTTTTWQCISAAFGSLLVSDMSHEPSQEELADVRHCAWDGYVAANRACDASRMADCLHPDFRLTKVVTTATATISTHDTTPTSSLLIQSRDVFCDKVAHRYQRAPHGDYAHLQHDPRAAQHDACLWVSISSPRVAMVKLKIGHPPCLWTDMLTCVRLLCGSGPNEKDRWTIVHKSSCCEGLLVDEKQADAEDAT